MRKYASEIFFWSFAAVGLLVLLLWVYTVALADAPRYIAWDASQFFVKAKVTRYLLNGSSIEHRYITLKAARVCNGYVADPPVQTCGFQLETMDDLAYSYRIREYDRDGRQVKDTMCTPMHTRWACAPTAR
jgi:hypothetical protein